MNFRIMAHNHDPPSIVTSRLQNTGVPASADQDHYPLRRFSVFSP